MKWNTPAGMYRDGMKLSMLASSLEVTHPVEAVHA